MTDRAFIDSNVSVYAFDTTDRRKQELALGLFAHPRRFEPVVSGQVLSEFYNAVTRKLRVPLSPAEALLAVQEFSALEVVPIDAGLVIDAIRLCGRYQLSYWDGLILAAAVQASCPVLLSEDFSHGAVLSGVRIENPFVFTA